MEWLAKLFEKYPEMGVYLAVGIGYSIGRFKFRGVGLGAVTGSLLGGTLLGSFFHIPVSDQAKSILFLLFLFGIGYSVGPSFFRNLRGDGLRWAALAVFVPVIGLATSYLVARFLKLDPGFSAGLLSGALTESPSIGTASEAIRSLPLPDGEKQQLIDHIAVADAICYIFGTFGVIWCCSSLGPKLLRIDLRAESQKLERTLGIRRTNLGVQSAWHPVGFRAYSVAEDSPIAGKTVSDAERTVPSARLFVERIRRKGDIFVPAGGTVLEAGDTVAVLGRTEILVRVLGRSSTEVADPELLEIPVAAFDLYVTKKQIAGKTLREMASRVDETRGVLLRGVSRGSHSLPIGTELVIERGDTLQVIGSEAAVRTLARAVGRVLGPVEESDLATVGLAIFSGCLIGSVVSIPVGGLQLTLGTSVGTLLIALIVGWIRSVKPWFGRMPDAAIHFMRSIGLAAFVAMIGLKAGPIFATAVKEYGYVLFFGGIVVTLVPLLTGLVFGRYVLKLNPVLLLGGIAGAQTMIAGVAAMQDKSESEIATLGYSYTVAIAHILLTTWGSVIVGLVSWVSAR